MIMVGNGRTVVKGSFLEITDDLTQALRAVHQLVIRNAKDAPGSPEELADFIIETAIDVFKENKEIKKSEQVHNYAYKADDTEFEQFLKDKYNLPL